MLMNRRLEEQLADAMTSTDARYAQEIELELLKLYSREVDDEAKESDDEAEEPNEVRGQAANDGE